MREAARRPAAMAWITVEGPSTQSPAPNTPALEAARIVINLELAARTQLKLFAKGRAVQIRPLADGHDHRVSLDALGFIGVEHNARRLAFGKFPMGGAMDHLGHLALRPQSQSARNPA
jgi:hypothetical protein